MRVSIRHIQDRVAADFGVSGDQVRARSKVQEWAHPRQVAMFMARELTPLSLPSIGRVFNRDHSTVLHGIAAVRRRMATDRALALKIEARMLLLQCEPQKVVDTRNIGFLGVFADRTQRCSPLIHRGFNTSTLDDPAALAA
jgi:hypothetical protein